MTRIAIIGAGRMGKAHAHRLGKIEGVRIVGVCDIVPESADALAEATGARPYADCGEMLERERPDAVWICSPANRHSEHVRLALRYKVPFLLEKPVAVDLNEARAVRDEVMGSGLLHSVGYMSRYLEIVGKLRELLEGEALAMVHIRVFWTIPVVDSIKSKEAAGGQVVDQATHLVDLARYLVGEVEAVYSRRIRGLFPEEPLYTGDDASATVFTFRNGVVGNLICTYALFPEITREYPFQMFLICKRKLIEYTAGAKVRVLTPRCLEEFPSFQDGFELEDRAFVEAVRTGDPSRIRSDYGDAFRTLEVTLAANRSMETGEVVEIL
ncbi:MAG TPA: Gfo/Idh/MocA family oxidoreductase [Candidatus Latescibacteria bacterium]|nr:Gfo/Idh/MocA family oxidoreductase [Candidatus Latescibacterota bacterium]